ncbi:MAG TPA: hypothetical protein VKV38_08115 [Trebonia sp.]|nr:hypothetical protein [Trebonia sp.]
MRMKRAVIVPAILALSAAGSVLAGSAVPLLAAQAPAAQVLAAGSSATPDFFVHG